MTMEDTFKPSTTQMKVLNVLLPLFLNQIFIKVVITGSDITDKEEVGGRGPVTLTTEM